MNPHLLKAAEEFINEYAEFLEAFDPYYQHEDTMASPKAYVRGRIMNEMEEILAAITQWGRGARALRCAGPTGHNAPSQSQHPLNPFRVPKLLLVIKNQHTNHA